MADIHNFSVCISFNILWQNRLIYTRFRVKDMQNAIPSDFDLDMNGTVSGFNGFGQTQAFDVTIPLTIDGITLTKVVSRIQWSQNKVTVRNRGV